MTRRALACALVLGALLAAVMVRVQAEEPVRVAAASPTSPPKGDRYWTDSERGWHFYEDPEPEFEDVPIKPKAPAAKPAPKKAPELVEFEGLQKQLEETRNIAIINPSERNVRRYMEVEAKVINQASYFADVAQRVAWATPELDLAHQGRPVNTQALEVYEQQQTAARNDTVSTLGRDHVLFFFFRSDCPYCHRMGPMLEFFSRRHGIQIVPVSLDGGGLPSFPEFRRDNGIANTLQVSQVPALFLAQPFTGVIKPVGYGVLSESDLLERIEAVSSAKADTMTPGITRRLNLR